MWKVNVAVSLGWFSAGLGTEISKKEAVWSED